MRKSSLAFVVVFLVAAAVVAWFWASPYFAIAGLRNAAVRGDASELESRVDFPRFRESIKTQFSAFMMAGITERLRGNPFAALGVALAAKLTDVMIESMVTPTGMLSLMDLTKNSTPEISGLTLMVSPNFAIRRDGLSAFEFYSAKDTEQKPTLRFNRYGLEWRLVGIWMPKEFLEARTGGAIGREQATAPYVPKWELSDQKDPMDDTVSIYLSRDADEEVSGRFSRVRPTMVFRCHKKQLEAYINLQGMVDYDYQTHRSVVRLRFDDGKANPESWIASQDREALFAPNAKLFLSALRNSSTLLFEWHQSGDRVTIAKFTRADLEAHIDRLADACDTRGRRGTG
jgi:Protein of unknown function (DUF2939)